jgi:hypothetical protein
MRFSVPVLAGLAALAVPAAALAASTAPASTSAAAPLVLVADGPVVFSAPTDRCPIGIATATVTVAGTGEQAVSTACAKSAAPCGQGCTRFMITYDIPLAGGTIRNTVKQRQVATADRRVVGVTVRGKVRKASGAYADLVGAPVNGGGAFVVQSDGTIHLNLATAITPTA